MNDNSLLFLLAPSSKHSVAFNPNLRQLASGGLDSTILVWDLQHPKVCSLSLLFIFALYLCSLLLPLAFAPPPFPFSLHNGDPWSHCSFRGFFFFVPSLIPNRSARAGLTDTARAFCLLTSPAQGTSLPLAPVIALSGFGSQSTLL